MTMTVNLNRPTRFPPLSPIQRASVGAGALRRWHGPCADIEAPTQLFTQSRTKERDKAQLASVQLGSARSLSVWSAPHSPVFGV